MKAPRIWFALLMMTLVPGILLANLNLVYEGVTLQLKAGWTYSDVSVQESEDKASVIVIRQDGASMHIAVERIAVIINAEGADITGVVLQGRTAQDKYFNEFGNAVEPDPITPWVPNSLPLPPKFFNIMVGGGLGYGMPIANYYNGMDDGMLYYFDARISISPLAYVKFAYRSEHMFDESAGVHDEYTGDYLGQVRVKVNARQYLFSYGIVNRPSGKNHLRGYVEIGAGMVDHVVEASFGPESGQEIERRITFLAAAGFLIPFGENLGMDCGLTLQNKMFNGDKGEGAGILFSAQMGLIVKFGSVK